MSENITRPIIGIENRTAQEVFDIMVARIEATPAPLPISVGWRPVSCLKLRMMAGKLRKDDPADETAALIDEAAADIERLAQAPAPAELVRVYPGDLTDDLRDILSMMMWTTGPMAHALRAGGQDIKRKAEEEQAEVLHWLIGLALEHGPAWREKASDRIREIRDARAALASTEGTEG